MLGWAAPWVLLIAVAASTLPLLEDQFGRQDGPALHPEGLVILICGAPNKLRQMKSWEEGLQPRLNREALFLRLVDGREIAPQQREQAKATLREKVPPEIAILLDWEGRYWKALQLEPGTVELTFFSGGQALSYRISGRFHPAAATSLVERLGKVGGGP